VVWSYRFFNIQLFENAASLKKVMEKVLMEKGRLKRFTAVDDAVKYLQSRKKQKK